MKMGLVRVVERKSTALSDRAELAEQQNSRKLAKLFFVPVKVSKLLFVVGLLILNIRCYTYIVL